MSNYSKQELDLVERTKEIITQYDSFKLEKSFEVTLLINCLVGMLIIPQQELYGQLPNDLIEFEPWGLT